MPRAHRLTAFIAALLVSALVPAIAMPGQAGAVTHAERSRRAAAAARLNALRASDRELSGAVSALTTQVNAQISRVNSAKRAALAAESDYEAAAAELAATDNRIKRIQGAVKTHAVETYMRPQGRGPGFDSRDLAELSRQRALWDHVEHRQDDALDELRAARRDKAARESAASRARDRAAQRKRDETAQLDGLARDLRDRQRMSAALEARIRAAEAEDSAAQANNASINSLLSSGNGAISKAGLIWPVRGQVTSGYGQRWGRMHQGIDIAASGGTPIKAARAGKVVFSGWMGGYGNAIIVDHGGGFATLYGHQSKRIAEEGETVKQGEVIGKVGSTGHSTGNHLHFETRVNGQPRNPRNYLP